MNKNIILLETRRDAYTPNECGATLTVGELIEILSDFDEETPVFFSNDNGYTYGAIKRGRINATIYNDDDE